jgi:hypothetical protein
MHIEKARDLVRCVDGAGSNEKSQRAAVYTLNILGYTWQGGELWMPPLGPAPRFDPDTDACGPCTCEDCKPSQLRDVPFGGEIVQTSVGIVERWPL